jgi:hypothetical protein
LECGTAMLNLWQKKYCVIFLLVNEKEFHLPDGPLLGTAALFPSLQLFTLFAFPLRPNPELNFI